MPAKSRKYSDGEVERAIATLAFCGGNAVDASHVLAEQGLEIHKRTLQRWKRDLYALRYAEAEAIYRAGAGHRFRDYHWPEIGAVTYKLVRALAREAEDRLEAGDIQAARRRARRLTRLSGQEQELAESDYLPGREVPPLADWVTSGF